MDVCSDGVFVVNLHLKTKTSTKKISNCKAHVHVKFLFVHLFRPLVSGPFCILVFLFLPEDTTIHYYSIPYGLFSILKIFKRRLWTVCEVSWPTLVYVRLRKKTQTILGYFYERMVAQSGARTFPVGRVSISGKYWALSGPEVTFIAKWETCLVRECRIILYSLFLLEELNSDLMIRSIVARSFFLQQR